MHQIRRILEMQLQGRSIRQTAELNGVSRNTARDYLRRIADSGMDFNELLLLDDESLRAIVYVDPLQKAAPGRSIDQRYGVLKAKLDIYSLELKKRGVTRQLLWNEYRSDHPDGYGYTQFCEYLHQHLRLDEAVMHFTHRPAESCQVDFAGKKLGYVDGTTGEFVPCETLVGVLPFSHYIDNMRTAVLRSNRYEPVFTEAMEYFAAHYGTTAITARVRKPRDKGSVEKAVDLAYKHIYAPLRNKVFYSLQELNAAIARQVEIFNNRPFKNKSGSRRELFEQHEKPALKPLLPSHYEIKHTTEGKVQRNYHVIVGEDRHQYSVPYTLIGKRLKIIYTADVVEIYDNLKRVALHKRSYKKNGYTTNIEHRPANHQSIVEQRGWDDSYFLKNAASLGPSVEQVIKSILESRVFYEQTYNSCLGILRLAKQYGTQRLEVACCRALGATRLNYGIINNILKNNLDKLSSSPSDENTIPDHHQIRGSQTYQ